MRRCSEGVGSGSLENVPELPNPQQTYEFLDCKELALRWNLPESWIRDQTRARSVDPIPRVQFGKYVRFRWGSPELKDWTERRIVATSNRVVGRALGKEST